KQARQLIAHKHVSIGDQIVNIPSYMVSLEEESLVKLNIVLKIKTPKKSKEETIKEDIENEKAEEGENSNIQ
ncbi:MAG: S4 domain-containing protein, partial [Candidatus Pacearchaeota archaeon]